MSNSEVFDNLLVGSDAVDGMAVYEMCLRDLNVIMPKAWRDYNFAAGNSDVPNA